MGLFCGEGAGVVVVGGIHSVFCAGADLAAVTEVRCCRGEMSNKCVLQLYLLRRV